MFVTSWIRPPVAFRSLSRLGVVALLAATAAGPAVAAEGPPETPPEWRNTTDIGLVDTSGNTEVTSLAIGEALVWQKAPWKAAFAASLVYARQDGVKTSEAWKAQLRFDRSIDGRLSAFAHGGWERNVFAGLERRFEEGAGLSLKALDRARDLVVMDAGVVLTQQRLDGDLSESFLAGRGALLYKHMFAEKAWLQQSVEILLNFEESSDWRLNAETALVAPLSRAIALKAAHLLRHDAEPVAGFKKTDRILTTGIQLTF